jgi:hypothetical protein
LSVARKGGIAWENALATATLSVSSEAASLPAANLVSPHRADRWRTVGAADAWLRADFGAPVTIGLVALFGSNLTTGGQIRIRLGTTAGAGDVHDSTLIAAGIAEGYAQAVYAPDPAVTGVLSARHLQIDLVDPSLSVAGYHEAGFAWAGPLWSPERNFSYGWPMGWDDRSVVTKSRGGQAWVDALPKARSIELGFDWLTETERDAGMLELQRRAGRTKNIVVIPKPDRASRARETVMGLVQYLSKPIESTHGRWSAKLGVEERL